MERNVKCYINKETRIGEIVQKYPESIDILMAAGMHCLGCAASQMESLEDACMVHGIDSQLLEDALNQVIEMKRA